MASCICQQAKMRILWAAARISDRAVSDLCAAGPATMQLLRLALATQLVAAAEATIGMGGTPSLGYNNCNIQCCNDTFPNAPYVKGVADSFVSLGLKDAGYLYVNM